jgi:hypothetical protein
MAHQDYTRQNQYLQQAQKIVFELLACVDVANGAEIATNLIALYEYVINELVRANIEDKSEPLDHCVKVLGDLRQTWNELDSQVRSEIAHAASYPSRLRGPSWLRIGSRWTRCLAVAQTLSSACKHVVPSVELANSLTSCRLMNKGYSLA